MLSLGWSLAHVSTKMAVTNYFQNENLFFYAFGNWRVCALWSWVPCRGVLLELYSVVRSVITSLGQHVSFISMVPAQLYLSLGFICSPLTWSFPFRRFLCFCLVSSQGSFVVRRLASDYVLLQKSMLNSSSEESLPPHLQCSTGE